MQKFLVWTVVLASLVVPGIGRADEPAPKSATPSVVKTAVARAATAKSTTTVPATKAAPGQIRLIAYYSTKATTLSKFARDRQVLAKRAADRAKLPVAQGGLGMVAGFRDIEDEISLKDFISNCSEGEAEAQAYLPLIRRGAIVLVLTDGNENEWFYGPSVLNNTMDEFVQITFMRDEHARLNPQHAQVVQPQPANPSAVVASTNPAPVISTASANTGSGNQK